MPLNQPATLPDLDMVAAEVHQAWIVKKQSAGITSRKAEDGEELMVPFRDLSAKQQDMDRELVRTVYAAIEALAH